MMTTFVGVGIGAQTAQAVANDDWLGIVNTYRTMSGLGTVGANQTWSNEATAHSCYMLQNGITHDEIPGRPGYTPGGDIAGNSGNVAVSSSLSATARNHIDLWMTGPFHAIGILRHNLVTSGFGLCNQEVAATNWRSGGTLDVIRGIDGARPRPSTPIVFPGNGATVPLNAFVAEYPNPMTMCNWTGSAGLPLIAMMPGDVTSANSTITGPNGPMETCTLHEGNAGDPTARAILGGDNAIVVMPRQILVDGTYTVTVNSDGGNVTWSFSVDKDGPLGFSAPPPEPDTTGPTAGETRFEPVTPFRLVDSRAGQGTLRLQAGKITTLAAGGSDVTAVSANFTAVQPSGSGYITAYNCTTKVPTVSTLGYRPGQNIANQAIVPLQGGNLCLYSYADVDIIIDVNGFYRNAKKGSGFTPITPARLLDTRPSGTRLEPMQARTLNVLGVAGGVPAGANGVALNVTAVQPAGPGWLRAYPCTGASSSDISSVNFVAGDVRPNSVVVPVDGSGQICLLSSQPTDVIVDITGYFVGGAGFDFVPLAPIRLVDTRERWEYLNPFTSGGKVGAGTVLRVQVAGVRGVPGDAKAASVNVTAIQADATTFVTAFPCGARPGTSNLNLIPWQGVAANGAMVQLSSAGELCVYVDQPAHVVIDINGVWR